MFSRRAFANYSFGPQSFAFEIYDDGEEQPNSWGCSLGAAHIEELAFIDFLAKMKAKRRREEFAMVALL